MEAISSPWGVALNSLDGCLYICDYFNNKIHRIAPSGTCIILCITSIYPFVISLIGEVRQFAQVTLPKGIIYLQERNCFLVISETNIVRVSMKGKFLQIITFSHDLTSDRRNTYYFRKS